MAGEETSLVNGGGLFLVATKPSSKEGAENLEASDEMGTSEAAGAKGL